MNAQKAPIRERANEADQMWLNIRTAMLVVGGLLILAGTFLAWVKFQNGTGEFSATGFDLIFTNASFVELWFLPLIGIMLFVGPIIVDGLKKKGAQLPGILDSILGLVAVLVAMILFFEIVFRYQGILDEQKLSFVNNAGPGFYITALGIALAIVSYVIRGLVAMKVKKYEAQPQMAMQYPGMAGPMGGPMVAQPAGAVPQGQPVQRGQLPPKQGGRF